MNKTRTSISIEELSSTLTYIELVLIGTIMIIICAVTIIGNALVVTSFILDKKLRTLSNYFILSLAVSDIMIATFSMPLFIVYLLFGEWILGPVVCDIWLAQDYTCSNASCLNLLMIAIDRYLSVSNPLRYRAKRTAKRVGIMISCVWIISFLLWPPWIYAWPYIEGKRTVPEDDCYIQFLETNTYVTIITTVLDYHIPVLIILVLYYKIWRETKNRSRYLNDMETVYQSESICLQTQNYSSEKNKKVLPLKLLHCNFSKCNTSRDNPNVDVETEKDTRTALLKEAADNKLETTRERKIDNKNADRDLTASKPSFSSQSVHSNISTSQKGSVKHDKAARVLTVIILAFLITTFPYNIIVIIMNLDSSHSIVPDTVWNFFYYFFYINSTLNPLCYALANENFRMTYWRILTCSWSRKSPGSRIGCYSSSDNKSICNAKQEIPSL